MEKKIQYIDFLKGLPWQDESTQVLSGQISACISIANNPVYMGMSCIFILLKKFRDEGHSDDLLYKYEAVVGEIIERFDFRVTFPSKAQ
ncbi:hypothetical protein [Xenorhabdus szentirmaii]|uniref:hypothetical protein n=2 Tax=Xenorhabdus szentirmaii TaxID=290112 RepID=UPI0019AB142D|nr:hypothetical protein [Xenorhabdus sp. 38]MBD2780839.1 hypothetical protein [Xenorhabdus sp. 38]